MHREAKCSMIDLNFTSSHVFIKSAIVVLKKLLYYLEDGNWDAEDQLAYKSPTKTMQAVL